MQNENIFLSVQIKCLFVVFFSRCTLMHITPLCIKMLLSISAWHIYVYFPALTNTLSPITLYRKAMQYM